MIRWIEDRLNCNRITGSMRKFNKFIAVNDLIDPRCSVTDLLGLVWRRVLRLR